MKATMKCFLFTTIASFVISYSNAASLRNGNDDNGAEGRLDIIQLIKNGLVAQDDDPSLRELLKYDIQQLIRGDIPDSFEVIKPNPLDDDDALLSSRLTRALGDNDDVPPPPFSAKYGGRRFDFLNLDDDELSPLEAFGPDVVEDPEWKSRSGFMGINWPTKEEIFEKWFPNLAKIVFALRDMLPPELAYELSGRNGFGGEDFGPADDEDDKLNARYGFGGGHFGPANADDDELSARNGFGGGHFGPANADDDELSARNGFGGGHFGPANADDDELSGRDVLGRDYFGLLDAYADRLNHPLARSSLSNSYATRSQKLNELVELLKQD